MLQHFQWQGVYLVPMDPPPILLQAAALRSQMNAVDLVQRPTNAAAPQRPRAAHHRPYQMKKAEEVRQKQMIAVDHVQSPRSAVHHRTQTLVDAPPLAASLPKQMAIQKALGASHWVCRTLEDTPLTQALCLLRRERW